MQLHNLKRSKGLTDKSKQIGRGNGSGKGNYSTKGLKGQKARAGFSLKPSFEGGQTNIIQRMPKRRGFHRYFKLVDEYSVVNLGDLEKNDKVKGEVTKELLVDLGYARKDTLVKILGRGELTKKLNFVRMDKFSKSAKETIEKNGGEIK